MITRLASASANCNVGSWVQKWKCGWHEPTTTAGHAGYTFGEWGVPVLIAVVILFVVVRLLSRRGRGRSPSPQGRSARRPVGTGRR